MRGIRRQTIQAVELVAVATALLMGVLPSTATAPGGVEIVNASPALATHVENAIGAFVDGGLPVPTVASITFDADHPFCESHGGRYTDSTRAALVCFDAQTMRDSDGSLHRTEERLLLHELAHAWTQQHTTAEQREAFMALHGVQRWNDGNDRWHQRGTEIAAETFVWVLWDRDDPPRSLASKDPHLLAQGFELLTGVRSLPALTHAG